MNHGNPSAPSAPGHFEHWHSIRLSVTAVWAGVLTLGVEIVAGRLLAPFFGSSLHQWAALIGVVLIAYMIGYAAFRFLTRFGIAVPMLLGGLYVLSLPWWLYDAVRSLLSLPIEIASILGAVFSVGIPSVLWAAALPFVQAEAGNIRASRVLAWSSAGNLVGAWGVAFFCVPVLGTRTSLFFIGAIAVAIAFLWVREFRGKWGIVAGAAGAAGAVLLGLWAPAPQTTLPVPSEEFQVLRETAYQQIAVWKDRATSSTVLALNGNIQFYWDPSSRLTRGRRYEYYNYSTAAATWAHLGKSASKRMLVIGLGGGLVPWQYKQFFPEAEVTAFEIDPGIVEVARGALPLGQVPDVPVKVGDGRALLRQDDQKYDCIQLDTFLNSYVPFHLTTREFFELVRDRLAPGGILVANFHTIFETSGLLPKLEATIRSVFPSVAALNLPAGNTLVVASSQEQTFTQTLRTASEIAPTELASLSLQALAYLRPATRSNWTEEELLTDDRNDTEQRLYLTRQHILIPHRSL